MDAVLEACLRSWPERPALDPSEWPYRKAELDTRISDAMTIIAKAAAEQAPYMLSANGDDAANAD